MGFSTGTTPPRSGPALNDENLPIGQIRRGTLVCGRDRGQPDGGQQDGEPVLRKRWSKDVAQKAGARIVVDGTRTGLGVQVETAVLHHKVADDLGPAVSGEDHGFSLAVGRPCGRQPGIRQLRQHWVAGNQSVVDHQAEARSPPVCG
jgi:hypothetical protein